MWRDVVFAGFELGVLVMSVPGPFGLRTPFIQMRFVTRMLEWW